MIDHGTSMMYSVDADPTLELQHEITSDAIAIPARQNEDGDNDSIISDSEDTDSSSNERTQSWSQKDKPWQKSDACSAAGDARQAPMGASDQHRVRESNLSSDASIDVDNDQLPNPEHKDAGVGDDTSTATGTTADMYSLSREGSQGSAREPSISASQERPSGKSDDDVRHQRFELDLEEGNVNGSHPRSPTEKSHQPKLNDTNNLSNELECLDFEEPPSNGYTQDEFEVAIEVYEDEIRQLEKMVRSLKADVTKLTAAASMSTISEGAKKVVALEQCRGCGEERAISSQEDNMYIEMVMKEETLRKKNKKLHKALKSEVQLTRQLSMNLKTAADKITDIGHENDMWKAKYDELAEKVQAEGLINLL